MKLTDDARRILQTRYCREKENPEDIFKRVAKAVGKANKREEEYKTVLENLDFLPNSPCIRNAGFSNMAKACFVLPVGDSMDSIFKALHDAGIIFKEGGGVGYNFSGLREKDAPISAGGTSSGAISFMKIFNSIIEAVKQGGFRRGASMGILDYDHPEILDFIKLKLQNNVMTNFNISVLVDDDFMSKIEKGENIYLRSRRDKRIITGKMEARDIFDVICYSAWICADPGLIFKDRVNQDNPYDEVIDACNPCITGDTLIQTTEGEVPIKDLVRRRPDLYTMDNNGNLSIKKAKNVFYTGNKKVIKIKTTKGNLECTYDHKIFTANKGWVKAIDLNKGDRIVNLSKRPRGAYTGVKLSTQDKFIMEHRFILEYYHGIIDWGILAPHHIDKNKNNNHIFNLQLLPRNIHQRYEKLGNNYYNKGNNGRFVKKNNNKKITKRKEEKFRDCRNFLITEIIDEGKVKAVYDITVPETHNFIANRMVVHNCGEQFLFPHESCCLGSINLKQCVKENGKLNKRKLKHLARTGANFLLDVNKLTKFAIEECYKQQYKYNRIGLGVMGFADMLCKMGIYYDSDEALHVVDEIGSIIKSEAKSVSPSSASVLSIAPTGTLSIIGNCIEENTLIDTLEGKIKIRDLENKNPYLYSYDIDSNNIKIQKAKKVWCSGKKEVFKIHFDTGDFLEVTKDHPLLMTNNEYKTIKNLKIGESIKAFHKYFSNDYYHIFTNTSNSIKQSKVAYESLYGQINKNNLIHHIDGDKLNDLPENLEELFFTQYRAKHPYKLTEEKRKKIAKKISDKFKDEKFRKKHSKAVKEGMWFKKGRKNYKNGMQKRRSYSGEENPGYKGIDKWGCSQEISIKKYHHWRKEGIPKYIKGHQNFVRNHKIVKIEKVGTKKVYDIDMGSNIQNFSANGVFVHNCSASIEPIFSRSYVRKLTSDVGEVEEKRYGKYVRTAHEVSPEWHLKIQARWQKYVDNGVSKTINLSNEASISDVKDIYYKAWKMGCKGITIYRDGSKGEQVYYSKCDGESCHL